MVGLLYTDKELYKKFTAKINSAALDSNKRQKIAKALVKVF